MSLGVGLSAELDQKIADGIALIAEVCQEAHRPVVYSSFGKDSMVLLELVKRAGKKLPIIFHREPFFPAKYEFANRVIQAEGYTVYDYPPETTCVTQAGESIEVINLHRAGVRGNYMPTGISAPVPGEPWLCGLWDIYAKPTAKDYVYPWDAAFIGHKNTDGDPILGSCPLKSAIVRYPELPFYAFPLREFTDADIWAATEAFGLPISGKRYNRENGWKEHESLTFNPDYFPACTKCFDLSQPAMVSCPLIGGKEIPNISGEVRRFPKDARPGYVDYGAAAAPAAAVEKKEG